MKKILYILTVLITVSCGYVVSPVEKIYGKEKVIMTTIEQELNKTPYWTVEVDSVRFSLKETRKEENIFDCEVFGTFYDNFDAEFLEYYDADFVSHIEIVENGDGRYIFNSEDVAMNCEVIKKILIYDRRKIRRNL